MISSLSFRPPLDQVVDQDFHRIIAVAHGDIELAPFSRIASGKQEVIEPSHSDDRIADASGNAGTEKRDDHFAGMGADVMPSRQNHDRDRIEARIEKALLPVIHLRLVEACSGLEQIDAASLGRHDSLR
ncbi:MAG: hypothetical protein R3C97_02440 [Geminicoccaceae bacterium]